MRCNFVADSFHTKKLCSRLSSRKSQSAILLGAILLGKRSFCVFEPPSGEGGGGGVEATYDVHVRLIGKRVGDLLLVLIELFC